MRQAVAYMRVSTQGQTGEDAFGLDAQKEQIIEYCNANDIAIVDWFIDEGVSGADPRKPGLDAIVAGAATNPPVEMVVTAKNDRISRKVEFYYAYKIKLQEVGISIVRAVHIYIGFRINLKGFRTDATAIGSSQISHCKIKADDILIRCDHQLYRFHISLDAMHTQGAVTVIVIFIILHKILGIVCPPQLQFLLLFRHFPVDLPLRILCAGAEGQQYHHQCQRKADHSFHFVFHIFPLICEVAYHETGREFPPRFSLWILYPLIQTENLLIQHRPVPPNGNRTWLTAMPAGNLRPLQTFLPYNS